MERDWRKNMEKNDISYKSEEFNTKFNFRVALIATNNNKILLQKSDKDHYWSLIGGRVKLNEDTKSAVIREVLEETGVIIEDNKLNLIKVIENFFIYKETRFHEILYIYKVENNEGLSRMHEFKTLDKDCVINKWIDTSEIKDMDIRPSIVKECYDDTKLTSELIIE